jgi:hypothetical protein
MPPGKAMCEFRGGGRRAPTASRFSVLAYPLSANALVMHRACDGATITTPLLIARGRFDPRAREGATRIGGSLCGKGAVSIRAPVKARRAP